MLLDKYIFLIELKGNKGGVFKEYKNNLAQGLFIILIALEDKIGNTSYQKLSLWDEIHTLLSYPYP